MKKRVPNPNAHEPCNVNDFSDPKAKSQIIDEKLVLEGNRFNVHAMNLRGDDGNTYVREVIRHPGAVVLLPMLDADTVVLIKNSRPQVGETLLELPAGTREAGEPITETASRELIEETGYRAGELTLMQQFYSAPGISDELMYLFAATDLTQGDHQREATEQIENLIATRSEIKQFINEGRIRDAKTLVGLYAFLMTDQNANV